jgi:hypothetical protein
LSRNRRGTAARPDLTPDEADRCPHCGAFLRVPPTCCELLQWEYDEEERRTLAEMTDKNGKPFPDDLIPFDLQDVQGGR